MEYTYGFLQWIIGNHITCLMKCSKENFSNVISMFGSWLEKRFVMLLYLMKLNVFINKLGNMDVNPVIKDVIFANLTNSIYLSIVVYKSKFLCHFLFSLLSCFKLFGLCWLKVPNIDFVVLIKIYIYVNVNLCYLFLTKILDLFAFCCFFIGRHYVCLFILKLFIL